MTSPRPGCLRAFAVGLLCSLPLLSQPAGQPPAQPAKPQPTKEQPAQQKKATPFEAVPESTEPQPPKPQAPKLEPVKPAAEAAVTADRPPEDVVELVEFRGARRVPQD